MVFIPLQWLQTGYAHIGHAIHRFLAESALKTQQLFLGKTFYAGGAVSFERDEYLRG